MEDQNTTVKGGGSHYSGRNKIPTINEFISRLDNDKNGRDKQIDEAKKQQRAAQRGRGAQVDGEPQAHQNDLHVGENEKKVRDPTSGREVVIEDFGKDMMDKVDNPMVRWMYRPLQALY